MHGVHNLHGRLSQGLQRLVGGHHNGLWQAGYQVTASHLHGEDLGTAVGRAHVDLNLLGGPLADEQVVLFAHVAHQGLVEVVARHLDGGADHGAA